MERDAFSVFVLGFWCKMMVMRGWGITLMLLIFASAALAQNGSAPGPQGGSALTQPTYDHSGIGAPSGKPTSMKKGVKEKSVEVDPRTLKTGKQDEKFQQSLFGGDVKSITDVKPVQQKNGSADGKLAATSAADAKQEKKDPKIEAASPSPSPAAAVEKK